MDSPAEPSKPKGSYWKFVVAFLAIIFIVFSGLVGWGIYLEWRGTKGVERLAEALKRSQEDDYKRAMADTYGGKTPQETLQMYINAVEKGDYELASKYLIEEYQNVALNKLLNARQDLTDLNRYMGFLKNAHPWRSSIEDKNYVMEAKTNVGPSIFVRFIKYPNEVWKIIEI